MARYHALGIVSKKKEPKFFEKAKVALSEPIFSDFSESTSESINKYLKSIIISNPKIAIYGERLEKFLKDYCTGFQSEMTPEGPWSTIIHGDFWINNIMYHHNDDEKVDDVKFVDFQLTNLNNGFKDLTYFLFGSCSMDVLDNHFDAVVDEYYNNFINVLQKNEKNLNDYSKDKFDEELKLHAKNEIFRILFANKVFTHQARTGFQVRDMISDIVMAEASDMFREKTYQIFKMYAKKEWL